MTLILMQLNFIPGTEIGSTIPCFKGVNNRFDWSENGDFNIENCEPIDKRPT